MYFIKARQEKLICIANFQQKDKKKNKPKTNMTATKKKEKHNIYDMKHIRKSYHDTY